MQTFKPVCFLLLWVCLNPPALSQTTPALTPGQALTRDIAANETHSYDLTVAADMFVQFSSEQGGLRGSLRLFDPAGQPLSLMEDLVGGVRLTVKAIAASAGSYRVEFRAYRNQPAGRYTLRWAEYRAPTEQERLQSDIEVNKQTVLAASRNGQYAEAWQAAERALVTARRLQPPAPAVLVDMLNRVAFATAHLGEFARAESAYTEAIQLAEQPLGPAPLALAEAWAGLARLYIFYGGNYAVAADGLQRALAIYEQRYGAGNVFVANTLNAFGNLAFGAKDYDRAAAWYQRAAELLENQPSTSHASAFPLLGLGRVAHVRGQYEQAETYLRRALRLQEEAPGRDQDASALTMLALGKLAQTRGRLTEAAAEYQRAHQIFARTRGAEHVNAIETLEALAQLKLAQNEAGAALPYQMQALAAAQRNLGALLLTGSEQQRRSFLALYRQQTDTVLSLHLRLAPHDESARTLAATTLVQRKGLVQESFAQTLANLRGRVDAAGQPTLAQWQTVNAQLARLVLDGPAPGAAAGTPQQQLAALTQQRDQLESELSRVSAGSFQPARAVTLAAVQHALPAKAALLEFAVYRPFDPHALTTSEPYGVPRYAVYVIRPSGAVAWRELGEAATLEAALKAWRAALREPSRTDTHKLGRAVSARLWEPLQPLLGGVEHLLIAPDGALNLIPFEALPTAAGKYLLERYAVNYLSSGRELLRAPAPPSTQPPLVVADPLFGEPDAPPQPVIAARRRRSVTTGGELREVYFAPLFATAREARAIKTLFNDARLLTGAQATEAALKQAAAPRLLHIATHGFFLSDSTQQPTANVNPLLRAGLALAQANLRQQNTTGEDGILTALEAAGLNLWGTRLVTLSACDTGLGEVHNGEGVYGLRRAFALAGAETLVMSLWPVGDQVTRDLMTAFYTHLQHGQGRGAALRAAQLQLLKQPPRRAPYYWASFIQAGEWGALNGQR